MLIKRRDKEENEDDDINYSDTMQLIAKVESDHLVNNYKNKIGYLWKRLNKIFCRQHIQKLIWGNRNIDITRN